MKKIIVVLMMMVSLMVSAQEQDRFSHVGTETETNILIGLTFSEDDKFNYKCSGNKIVTFENTGEEILRVDVDGNVIKVSESFFDSIIIRKAICKKFGHRWNVEISPYQNLLYYPNGRQPEPHQTRTCTVCGKIQTLKVIPEEEKWEDVE